MLTHLTVKNYAVIDAVDVELHPGLSVMTGETGAGKSILVDALGLVLGDRADAGAVRAGAERAEISAQFDLSRLPRALGWLREQALDDGDDCSLRRLVMRDGRSKAFVNGQPVNLQSLRALGSLLIDIHGQHAHQSLLTSAAQRTIVDGHGGLEPMADAVAASYKAWQERLQRLDARRLQGEQAAAELDVLRFQIEELEALGLGPTELEELETEQRKLANVDRLRTGLDTALASLYEDDRQSAFALVASARHELERLLEFDPGLADPVRLLAGAEIELGEAASDLARQRDRTEADPDGLARVEERLARIRALARRHRVEPAELPHVLEALQARRTALDGGVESLAELEQQVVAARQQYFTVAEQLSERRRRSAHDLTARVTAQLAGLGLPHGDFRIALTRKPSEQADGNGLDNIEFEVCLNPGQPHGPLARVASGGELSRLSLAIEVVSAGATQVPTLVFDEVDTGVGGGVAEIVGRRLSEIAAERQVLCVTHLPQVASQGRHHYRISKRTDEGVTRADIALLDQKQRVEELSRMLGGLEITERARAHAEEMMARGAGSVA